MMIRRKGRASAGHAAMTDSKSASNAALSAAPLVESCVFPDDFDWCSVPTGSTDSTTVPYNGTRCYMVLSR